MSSTGIKFKLIQSVKDDAFNVDAIPDYTLTIQIGNESFRFCIIDTQTGKCLWLEDYGFSSILFTEQLLDQLNLIYDDHTVLQAGFWQNIHISFQNLQFTCIPYPLFKPELVSQYLQLTTDDTTELVDVFYYKHAALNLVNVFGAQRKMVEWFKAVYFNKPLILLHHTSAFIEGLRQAEASSTKQQAVKNLSLLIEPSYVTVALMTDGQLLYCNTFYYTSVQDFTYYVLMVMNELKLSPETCKVTLHGEISHDSVIFITLYKYIRTIAFGNKPAQLNLSYRFDELLDHRYFSVYNIYLCK